MIWPDERERGRSLGTDVIPDFPFGILAGGGGFEHFELGLEERV